MEPRKKAKNLNDQAARKNGQKYRFLAQKKTSKTNRAKLKNFISCSVKNENFLKQRYFFQI